MRVYYNVDCPSDVLKNHDSQRFLLGTCNNMRFLASQASSQKTTKNLGRSLRQFKNQTKFSQPFSRYSYF